MKRILAVLFLLLLPVAGRAEVPVDPAAASHASLGAPLKDWMADYSSRLGSQIALHYLGDDHVFHSWSPAQDRFVAACQNDKVACADVLVKQFDLLAQTWQSAPPGTGVTPERTALISALSELCQNTLGLDIGPRCLPQQRRQLDHLAAMHWMAMGQDNMFEGFASAVAFEEGQWMQWLERQTDMPAEARKRAMDGLKPSRETLWRGALFMEVMDAYFGAEMGWFQVLGQDMGSGDKAAALYDIGEMARLAALQQDHERANDWRQFADSWQSENNLPGGCTLDAQRFGLDVALARRSSDLPALARLRAVIDAGCGFTAVTLDYAYRALELEQRQRAHQAVAAARDACTRVACGWSRKQALDELQVILLEDDTRLMSLTQEWMRRLDHPALNRLERRRAWALARELVRRGRRTEAEALYARLDDVLDGWRNSPAQHDVRDLARYDDLKRERVKLAVEMGHPMEPAMLENLRAQTLLHQLRRERWRRQLASVRDPVAEATWAAQRAEVAQSRSNMQALLRQQPDQVKRLIQSVMDRLLDESLVLAEDNYLGKLINQREGRTGRPSSLALYFELQNENLFFSRQNPLASLSAEDAYLSWLKVPGGYIGTLLAVDPDGVRVPVLGSTHSLVQRFIPFSEEDEALLDIYRTLLQNGAGFSRGQKTTAAVEVDADGALLVNKLPLWQAGSQGWVVSQAPPPGAQRVRSLDQLSQAIHARLMAPFSDALLHARRLIISPDGALTRLPFESLHDGRGLLVAQWDISYAQSLAVYAELMRRVQTRKTSAPRPMLSVADPKYPAPNLLLSSSDPLRRLMALGWKSLPGTRKESQALVAGLSGQAQQLVGPAANKARLMQMDQAGDLSKFQILHFATHGYVDDERSALVLTPTGDPMSAYLRDVELLDWHLQSDLVLLSACNTGIGREVRGEGVVGLPYAFFMAGNINTLMSLWPVDDAGTAVFMPAFMQRVRQGQDVVQALADTKRAFAQGVYGDVFRNPRIWSAFVLYGVPQTMARRRSQAVSAR